MLTESRRGNSLHPLTVVLLLGLVYIGTGIGLRDPWPSDEPRFVLVAKEMVESGQWFFPTRGGELYPDKPPLFMWSQAVVYQVTGSIRIAALLPSLLCGLAVLLLIYDIGRRLWRPRVGFVAACLLLASPQFVLESRAGQIDAMVMAWIALGTYAFLRYLLLAGSARWLMIGFAACGLGVITKGVGFLPLLIFLPAALLRARSPSRPIARVGAARASLGLLFLLGAIALWLVPMLIAVAQSGNPAFEAYRDNILWQQTGQRYAAPSHHFKPFWYFIVEVIPPLWLPIFLLLPWLIPAWRNRWRRRDPRFVLLTCWAALVILFFSISPGKRGVYILPALPWVALAAAPMLSALLTRVGVRRMTAGALALLALVMIGGAAYLQWGDPERLRELIENFGVDPRALLMLFGASALLGLGFVTLRRPAMGFMATMLGLWLTYGIWLYPRLDPVKSGADLMLQVESALEPRQPLALVHWREQTLLQARRPAVNFGFLVPPEEQLSKALVWLKDNPTGAILMQSVDAIDCLSQGVVTDLGEAHRREWMLVEARDGIVPCG